MNKIISYEKFFHRYNFDILFSKMISLPELCTYLNGGLALIGMSCIFLRNISNRYHMKGTGLLKILSFFVTRGHASTNYAGILKRLIMQALLCNNHF